MGFVPLALAPGKVGARPVLGRDRAHSERANVVAVRQRRGLDDFAPGEHGVAREERRDMPAPVDRRDMEGVGEAVKAQGASERDHMPAIDEAAPKAPQPLAELVEMHLGGVLIEPGRRLVLGLFDAFWSGYLGTEYKDAAIFSLLILVLIFRPQGLLGTATNPRDAGALLPAR